MFAHRELIFPHKTILTSAMLTELYDFPREFFKLIFSDYTDGIICGLDYSINGGELILSRGIVQLDGEIYFLQNDLNISTLAEKESLVVDRKYFMTLEKFSSCKESCLTEKNLELRFTEQKPHFSLGSFIFLGCAGFCLPTLTEGEEPLQNIFRRRALNLIDVPFAAQNTATFHPLLFRLINNFLAWKKNKTPLDYALWVHLQNNATLSVQSLENYIISEGKTCLIDDRANFFKTFVNCLCESKPDAMIYHGDNRRDEPSVRRTPSRGRLLS